MLSAGNDDRHCTHKPHELVGAGIGNHHDAQITCAARHEAMVLEQERALAILDSLYGDFSIERSLACAKSRSAKSRRSCSSASCVD